MYKRTTIETCWPEAAQRRVLDTDDNTSKPEEDAYVIDTSYGIKMVRPGLEPGTFCVLDRCDNQLRHRTLFEVIQLLLLYSPCLS